MSSGSVDSDLLKLIDYYASVVASKGVVFGDYLKDLSQDNKFLSFLLSTDANHAIYQRKLAEYSALPEYRAKLQHLDIITIPLPYSEDTINIQVYDYPSMLPPLPFPQGMTVKEFDTMKLTAQFAMRYRTWFSEELKKRNDPQFEFMLGSDEEKLKIFHMLCRYYSDIIMPSHYSGVLIRPKMPSSLKPVVFEAFISLVQGGKHESAFVSGVDYFADSELPPPGQSTQRQFLAQHPFLEGITAKEYDTIKLTAQFAVRYRTWFLEELKKRNNPQFDFVESGTDNNDKFLVFNGLCGLYSRVIMPCHKKWIPCMEPVVEDFIKLLQREKYEGAFVSGFDYLAQIPLPKSTTLGEQNHVPEDQFLAQNPGSFTIKVSVPRVIEITVQSLAENVATLKEKVAAKIQVPANKLELRGRTGVLSDNLSLAHYNVGAEDILTVVDERDAAF